MIRRAIWRRRPFRWLWRLRATLLLRKICDEGWSWFDDWAYSAGLAEYMDECEDCYMMPIDAITEDRQYWEA